MAVYDHGTNNSLIAGLAGAGVGNVWRDPRRGFNATYVTQSYIPLDFFGPSALRGGGDRSSQLEFDAAARGCETNVGTTPVGSYWRKNPIPSGLWEREGPQFEPVCAESEACKAR